MKKLFLTFVFAIVATLTAMAQQISVVSTTGATTLYRTLQEAIEGADPGSVIYLPGGGFTISDEVKITKKLTIIGIGHKSNNDNVDGITVISGNLIFGEGSSGSAVLACYLAGGVDIGYNNTEVNDVLIRYCNLRGMNVASKCKGTIINQNILRWEFGLDYARITFNGASCIFTNNVSGPPLENINGGTIANNIIINTWYNQSIYQCNSLVITNNIIFGGHSGSNQLVSGNMTPYEWGEECINVQGVNWDDVFVNRSLDNYHLKDNYSQYEHQVGIYAGTGFNDKQLAPVPYIVGKRVDEQTDASGKLNVKIRVKASGEE